MSEGGLFPWKVQEMFSRVVSEMSPIMEGSSSPGPTAASPPRKKEESSSSCQAPSKSTEEPLLVTEKQAESPSKTVVEIPKDFSKQHQEQEENFDWEQLSERASSSSFGASRNSGVFVTRAGSVRSINSVDQSNSNSNSSVPCKIQRTKSDSTLDSQDNVLGPSGKGVLGVDYVEHVVLPTDTLQGICIAYKVSATNLRRANHFTGHSLHLAPKKLLIPVSGKALRAGYIRVQETDSKEYKLHYFESEFPDLSTTEAKA